MDENYKEWLATNLSLYEGIKPQFLLQHDQCHTL